MISIFTCECLLEHLVYMPQKQIEECIMNYVIFSLTDKWLMFIHNDNGIYFFASTLFILLGILLKNKFSA